MAGERLQSLLETIRLLREFAPVIREFFQSAMPLIRDFIELYRSLTSEERQELIQALKTERTQ